MPGGDFKGDHEELVDDEDGEAGRHHAGPVERDEELCEALDDAPLVDGDEHPNEEGTVAERSTFGKLFVELRVEFGQSFVDILVEHKREDGSHSVNGGVAYEEPVLPKREQLMSTGVWLVLHHTGGRRTL